MAESEIKTVQNLQNRYPDLCSDCVAARDKEIDSMPVEEARSRFPELIKRLAVPVVSRLSSKEGFILAADDPYAAGVARFYAGLAKCAVPGLPTILPFKAKHSPSAIKQYIVRAAGAGDTARATAAQKALAKCK